MPNLMCTLVVFCRSGFFPLNKNKESVTEQMYKAAKCRPGTRAWEPAFGSPPTPVEAVGLEKLWDASPGAASCV